MLKESKVSHIYRKFIWAGVALLIILAVGSVGYWLLTGRERSFLDAFYMTVITISTIGFGEIIDLSANPAGRIFTVLIGVSGIGVLFYIITNFTAYAVEGELTDFFRRRRMEKQAKNTSDHYIVCGSGLVGFHIIDELHVTERPHIIIEEDPKNAERLVGLSHDEIVVIGDATDNETLKKAGIDKAKGLFAVTDDDNQNLVICLTAKHINPKMRVVARCNQIKNAEKMKQAGADAVVSPNFIGGLRMASEMIRPTVVSFLDIMLRDREKNLRVEEVAVPENFVGKDITTLGLKKYPHVVLLAVNTKDGWIYSPPEDYVIKSNDTLVFMTTPKERRELKKVLQGD